MPTVCFENDADGNPAPIAPGSDNYNPDCEGSICSDLTSICYVNAPWPETFDAVPCRAGYGLSAMVQGALSQFPLPEGMPPLVPVNCDHPMAAACIDGCTGGATSAGFGLLYFDWRTCARRTLVSYLGLPAPSRKPMPVLLLLRRDPVTTNGRSERGTRVMACTTRRPKCS